MEIVLSVIVIAMLGGLLWSLWFVLTNPRRRARQVAAELSAPVLRTPEAFTVGYRRWTAGATAVFFALILANLMTRDPDAGAVVLGLAILGPVTVGFGKLAISGKPVLVIDGEGIIVSRKRRRLRWEDIDTIAVEEGKGYMGVETYSLVLHLSPGSVEPPDRHRGGLVTTGSETIETPLALLSPNWHEVARAIHERSGRRPIVPSRYAATEHHKAHVEL